LEHRQNPTSKINNRARKLQNGEISMTSEKAEQIQNRNKQKKTQKHGKHLSIKEGL
jgi:hypothetical protein